MPKPITPTLTGLAALLAAGTVWAGADDFRLDPVHTQVWFSVSHTGFSNPLGRVRIKSGSFHFDAGDWKTAKLDATLDITSLDLGDAAWSARVRSAFFDEHVYPTAHYVSTNVEKTGEHGGVVHGKLTLLGRTQPVDLKLTFNRAGREGYTLHYIAGFSATASFKRSTFGMDRDIPDVGDQVDVRIEAEGIRGDVPNPPPDSEGS